MGLTPEFLKSRKDPSYSAACFPFFFLNLLRRKMTDQSHWGESQICSTMVCTESEIRSLKLDSPDGSSGLLGGVGGGVTGISTPTEKRRHKGRYFINEHTA